MSKISSLFPSLFLSLCLGAGGLGFSAVPASAGFQWVPPEGDSSTQSVVTPDIFQEGQNPVVVEGRDMPSKDGRVLLPPSGAQPSIAAVPTPTHVLSLPSSLQSTNAPQPLAAAPTLASAAPAGGEKIVVGFADRVPLVVALRQVLPPEYGYSFDGNVTLGTTVSWKGGKPWRDVLSDMLAPVGYSIREQGMMVRIVKGDTPVASGGVVLKPAVSALPTSLMSDAALPVQTLKLPPGMRQSDVVKAEDVSAPAASDVGMSDAWTASRGDMLRKTLTDWATRAHVDVNWLAEYDYPILANISLPGSFEEAVRSLLAGFEEAQPQPVARLYSNPSSGQSVLIVEARGNNYGG